MRLEERQKILGEKNTIQGKLKENIEGKNLRKEKELKEKVEDLNISNLAT